MRALAKNLAAGGVEEGGSTLTQQLVKQTLLQTAETPEEQQAATEQTVGRKLKEARLALALEKTYSKDEILTRYLNIAYFGEGAYGIQAAAQRYFSVNAADLTLPQAAVLAGLVQSPTNDDPIVNPENGQKRRNQVLQRMHDLGPHHGRRQDCRRPSPPQPIAVVPGRQPAQRLRRRRHRRLLLRLPLRLPHRHARASTQQRSRTAAGPSRRRCGRTCRPPATRACSTTRRWATPSPACSPRSQPGTGQVLAMSVNRRYGCRTPTASRSTSTSPPARRRVDVQGLHRRRRPVGGLRPGYRINAPQPYISKVFKQNGGTRGALRRPTTTPTTSRLRHGRRADRLGEHLLRGPRGRAGLGGPGGQHRQGDGHALHPALAAGDCPADCTDLGDYFIAAKQGSFTLGPIATSPLDLASAYSTLAAHGTQCDPTPIVAVLGGDGQPVTKDDGSPLYGGTKCTPNAIPPGVADTLDQMLRNVVEDGTGRKAAIDGHEIVGKTGTIQGDKSATFVGGTPDYTVSVMYYNPKSQEDVGGHGGGIPAQIFHDAMAPILANEPNKPFAPADPAVAAGTRGAAATPSRRRPATRGRTTTPHRHRRLLRHPHRRPHPNRRPRRHRSRRRRPPGIRERRTPQPLRLRGPRRVSASWRRTSAATRPPSARPATVRPAPRPSPGPCPSSRRHRLGDHVGDDRGQARRRRAAPAGRWRARPPRPAPARPARPARRRRTPRPPRGASWPPARAPPAPRRRSARGPPCRRPPRSVTAASAIRSVAVPARRGAFIAVVRSACSRSFSAAHGLSCTCGPVRADGVPPPVGSQRCVRPPPSRGPSLAGGAATSAYAAWSSAPLHAAPLRRAGAAAGRRAAARPAPVRPAPDPGRSARKQVGGGAGRSQPGPGRSTPATTWPHLDAVPALLRALGAAAGPARGVRLRLQRLLRAAAQEPARATSARRQAEHARARAAIEDLRAAWPAPAGST